MCTKLSAKQFRIYVYRYTKSSSVECHYFINIEHDMLNPMLSETAFSREFIMTLGEQGWRSGESTRLPPMWPSSIPRLGVICGLSLSLVFVLALRGFFSGYSGFPLENQHFQIPIRS